MELGMFVAMHSIGREIVLREIGMFPDVFRGCGVRDVDFVE